LWTNLKRSGCGQLGDDRRECVGNSGAEVEIYQPYSGETRLAMARGGREPDPLDHHAVLPATTAARELSEQTTDRLIALLGWAQASSPEMSRFWMEWIVAEADTLLCRGAITEA